MLFRSGRWNFDDFLEQLEAVQKMGPLKKTLQMLPGLGQMVKNVDVSDDDLKPVKAIISSMTRQERRNPDLLNGSRRRRIAQGSGTSVPEVNGLIKQFKAMKKMTSTMMQLGGLGSLFSGAGMQQMMSKLPGGAAALQAPPRPKTRDQKKRDKAKRKQAKKNRKKR